MENGRIIIVMHSDLMHYPPMISLIDIMLELKKKIVYIGDYSDAPTINRFKDDGVELVKVFRNRVSNNKISILKNIYKYRRNLRDCLDSLNINDCDLVWYVYCDMAPAVHDLISKYRYLIHYYEFVNQEVNRKFRILFPSFDHKLFAQRAVTTIQCEYNRAQIFRGLNELEYMPFVLPNKPYIKDGSMDESLMPDNVKVQINDISERVKGKKVILYQGVFDSRERKLEEFCEAIQLLPEEFMLIAMGRGDSSYEELKSKYQSDRILFVPFIIPPFHLYVTKLASIGVLSYTPIGNTIGGVINPIYCAPNKIFEYGKYGIPMISNDIPGLKNIFDKYGCGRVVEYPLTASRIKDVILEIVDNYNTMSAGSLSYYESVDLQQIVTEISDRVKN